MVEPAGLMFVPQALDKTKIEPLGHWSRLEQMLFGGGVQFIAEPSIERNRESVFATIEYILWQQMFEGFFENNFLPVSLDLEMAG